MQSPKMREEGSARAQAQSGPQKGLQTSKQRDTSGDRDSDGPTGGLVGAEGAERGEMAPRRLPGLPPPSERPSLAGPLEGGALPAASAKVRAAASAPGAARARGSPALPPRSAVSGTFLRPWPPCSGATPAGPGAGAGRSCAGAACSRRGWLRAHPAPPRGSPRPSTFHQPDSGVLSVVFVLSN